MIQPLQSNSINFRSVELSPALKARLETQGAQQKEVTNQAVQQKEVAVSEQPKKKFSISETYQKGKKNVINFFKGVNNVTNVASGVARGAVEGIATTAVVGTIAKACKEQEFHIFRTTGQIVKDGFDALIGAIKFVPDVLTKSPIDNIKTISSLPGKFYKEYLKGHAGIAAAATVIGLAVLAFRAIQGKINANEKNADLDHKTNLGHV